MERCISIRVSFATWLESAIVPLLGASLQLSNTAHISSKAAPAKSERFVRDGNVVKGRVDDACVPPLAAVNTASTAANLVVLLSQTSRKIRTESLIIWWLGATASCPCNQRENSHNLYEKAEGTQQNSRMGAGAGAYPPRTSLAHANKTRHSIDHTQNVFIQIISSPWCNRISIRVVQHYRNRFLGIEDVVRLAWVHT